MGARRGLYVVAACGFPSRGRFMARRRVRAARRLFVQRLGQQRVDRVEVSADALGQLVELRPQLRRARARADRRQARGDHHQAVEVQAQRVPREVVLQLFGGVGKWGTSILEHLRTDEETLGGTSHFTGNSPNGQPGIPVQTEEKVEDSTAETRRSAEVRTSLRVCASVTFWTAGGPHTAKGDFA